MIEKKTKYGILKFKEPSLLELVALRGKLFKKFDFTSTDLSSDEYTVGFIYMLKDRFDFSAMETIKTFEQAEDDDECVDVMSELAIGILNKIGEFIKKKMLSGTHSMRTQEELQETN